MASFRRETLPSVYPYWKFYEWSAEQTALSNILQSRMSGENRRAPFEHRDTTPPPLIWGRKSGDTCTKSHEFWCTLRMWLKTYEEKHEGDLAAGGKESFAHDGVAFGSRWCIGLKTANNGPFEWLERLEGRNQTTSTPPPFFNHLLSLVSFSSV